MAWPPHSPTIPSTPLVTAARISEVPGSTSRTSTLPSEWWKLIFAMGVVLAVGWRWGIVGTGRGTGLSPRAPASWSCRGRPSRRLPARCPGPGARFGSSREDLRQGDLATEALATQAPAQKWMPPPKARCGFFSPVDVERLRVLEDRRVAVGGAHHDAEPGARPAAARLRARCRGWSPAGTCRWGRPSGRILRTTGRTAASSASTCGQLIRVGQQRPHRDAEDVARLVQPAADGHLHVGPDGLERDRHGRPGRRAGWSRGSCAGRAASRRSRRRPRCRTAPTWPRPRDRRRSCRCRRSWSATSAACLPGWRCGSP